jgi:DNA-binding NtrC family response regulator
MGRGHILVVAPQPDMRRSLEFVLDAEGFDVTSRAGVDFASPASSAPYDCIVMDHQALSGPREQVIDFFAQTAPVVLVSSKPIEWLSGSVKELIEKPVMGGAVANSVRRILASRAVSSPTK